MIVPACGPWGVRREEVSMNRYEQLRGQTAATIEQGGGNTEKLATEWAMPFIPDDGDNSPTDVPFRGSGPAPRRPVSGFVVFSGRIMMIFALVVLLGGVFAGFSMRGETATRSLQPQVFSVTGVPTVEIKNAVGQVEVVVGNSDKVELNANVYVRHVSRGLAEQALEGYAVDATQDPATGKITINARNDNPFGDGDFPGWTTQRSVNLTVALPRNSNVAVNVAAGRTVIEGITGRVDAQINAGSLVLADVVLTDGSRFIVNAGAVEFSGDLQPNASIDVEVNAGGAQFGLPRTTAARLVANADAGDIEVRGWSTGNIVRTRESDSRVSLDGYLTSDRNTSSVINVTVHAGGAAIYPTTPYPTEPEPPSAPPLPSTD